MSFHEIARAGYHQRYHYHSFRPEYTDESIGIIAKEITETVPSCKEISYDVLELGAGTGKFTSKILTRLPKDIHYMATEPSEDFLETLKKNVPGIETRCCAADSIPLPDNTVRCILCAQCFHWFSTNVALDEMKRVLIPGGKIVCVWNIRDVTVPWVKEVEDILARAAGSSSHILPTTYNWKKVFKGNTGFTNDLKKQIPGSRLKCTADSVVGYYSTFSMICSLDEKTREESLHQIRQIVTTNVSEDSYYPFYIDIYTYICNK